jgi:pSer/pThr/pTyr-binding forkhead associated (FHA) protein
MAKLTLSYNGVTLREYQLAGSRVSVGRRSDNNIRLDDPTVSGTHAIISLKADPYLDGQMVATLVDFNSTNGVFVNGERVKQQKLNSGDVIRIGQHELHFDQQNNFDATQTAVVLPED